LFGEWIRDQEVGKREISGYQLSKKGLCEATLEKNRVEKDAQNGKKTERKKLTHLRINKQGQRGIFAGEKSNAKTKREERPKRGLSARNGDVLSWAYEVT